VFVVPGTLQSLLWNDVLVSSDNRGEVGRTFWPVFGWSEAEGPRRRASVGSYEPGSRVFLAKADASADKGPRRWVVNVGAYPGAPVPWLLDGVREALAAVAQDGRGALVDGRPRRVAMPIMGVGRGGFDGQRGAVIHGLLDEAQRAADRLGLDVVLVAANPSDYSACQALREERHGRVLNPDDERTAAELAARARAGQLAIFMGAGTGIAAGLPSWSELLRRLAERLGVKDGEALSALGPLDAAELLRREAQKQSTEERGAENVLGAHVAEVIGTPSRYALPHAFLAALNADQVITTNFDRLYELAVREVRGPQPLVVLPDSDPADLVSQRDRRSWLLKLHGDIGDPESIVLDRRSFVRYDAWRRPLGGVLQTTLLTRHLLVVGASMTDDNVIRLIHEVAELAEKRKRPPVLGTVLSLRGDPLRADLWRPEFEFLDLSHGSDVIDAAARQLEIFLDRVALLAAPRSAHLLDPRYRELLKTEEEKELAVRVSEVAAGILRLSSSAESSRGWREIAEALTAWGALLN
jgi:hypothetical protein